MGHERGEDLENHEEQVHEIHEEACPLNHEVVEEEVLEIVYVGPLNHEKVHVVPFLGHHQVFVLTPHDHYPMMVL